MTARGLVTYYVAFLLDVQSRRVQVIGCTPYPNEAFVIQCLRHATEDTGLLSDGRLLLCDRDPKWSRAVRRGPWATHERQFRHFEGQIAGCALDWYASNPLSANMDGI